MVTDGEPAKPQSTGELEDSESLAGSAQGWHRIQLAVLGFIGLCGVLADGSGPRPQWLEELAAWLGITALVLACLAIYLVGRVAWPFGGLPRGTSSHTGSQASQTPENRGRVLRWGVALTYLATAVMALAALSNWWPDRSEEGTAVAGLVRVSAADGQSWCGRLVDAPTGSLRVVTDRGAVDLGEGGIAGIVSVDSC